MWAKKVQPERVRDELADTGFFLLSLVVLEGIGLDFRQHVLLHYHDISPDYSQLAGGLTRALCELKNPNREAVAAGEALAYLMRLSEKYGGSLFGDIAMIKRGKNANNRPEIFYKRETGDIRADQAYLDSVEVFLRNLRRTFADGKLPPGLLGFDADAETFWGSADVIHVDKAGRVELEPPNQEEIHRAREMQAGLSREELAEAQKAWQAKRLREERGPFWRGSG